MASAIFGGMLWLGAPLSPWPFGFASIEHLLLFMLLVGAPLGMLLHGRLVEPGSAKSSPKLAQLLQPFAAVMVLASFALPKGPTAGALIGLWGVTAAVFAATGSLRSGLNVGAAQIFILVGAVWLIFTRLGVHPAGISDERVLLGALHFQFSGFAMQLVAAATLRKASQRWIRVGLVAGIPVIAAGNLAALPPLRLFGAFTVIAATLGLATVLISFRTIPLRLAGVSLFVAMTVALVYAAGRMMGLVTLDGPHMAMTHGLINALGFTLFGILGHLKKQCPMLEVQSKESAEMH